MSSSNQDKDTRYQRMKRWFEDQWLFVILALLCVAVTAIGTAIMAATGGIQSIYALLGSQPNPIETGGEETSLLVSSEEQGHIASDHSSKELHDQQETGRLSSPETDLESENPALEQPTGKAPQIVEEAALPHPVREVSRVTAAERELSSGQNALSPTAEAVQQQADGFIFDLKFCKISGTSVKCELTITNKEEDRLLGVNVRFSRLFDEEDNEYRPETASIGGSSARRMVGMTREGPRKGTLLASGVPARTLLTFDGVPEDTSRLTLLEVVTNGPRIQFRNILLIRD